MKAEEMPKRASFENFKSEMCHRLKRMGDIDFMIDLLEDDDIRLYYSREWYPECFYTLGMLDYLSRINDVPICNRYNDLRSMKLEKLIYPSGIVASSVIEKSNKPRKDALKKAIPEFLRFNIVEGEVRDVI